MNDLSTESTVLAEVGSPAFVEGFERSNLIKTLGRAFGTEIKILQISDPDGMGHDGSPVDAYIRLGTSDNTWIASLSFHKGYNFEPDRYRMYLNGFVFPGLHIDADVSEHPDRSPITDVFDFLAYSFDPRKVGLEAFKNRIGFERRDEDDSKIPLGKRYHRRVNPLKLHQVLVQTDIAEFDYSGGSWCYDGQSSRVPGQPYRPRMKMPFLGSLDQMVQKHATKPIERGYIFVASGWGGIGRYSFGLSHEAVDHYQPLVNIRIDVGSDFLRYVDKSIMYDASLAELPGAQRSVAEQFYSHVDSDALALAVLEGIAKHVGIPRVEVVPANKHPCYGLKPDENFPQEQVDKINTSLVRTYDATAKNAGYGRPIWRRQVFSKRMSR